MERERKRERERERERERRKNVLLHLLPLRFFFLPRTQFIFYLFLPLLPPSPFPLLFHSFFLSPFSLSLSLLPQILGKSNVQCGDVISKITSHLILNLSHVTSPSLSSSPSSSSSSLSSLSSSLPPSRSDEMLCVTSEFRRQLIRAIHFSDLHRGTLSLSLFVTHSLSLLPSLLLSPSPSFSLLLLLTRESGFYFSFSFRSRPPLTPPHSLSLSFLSLSSHSMRRLI